MRKAQWPDTDIDMFSQRRNSTDYKEIIWFLNDKPLDQQVLTWLPSSQWYDENGRLPVTDENHIPASVFNMLNEPVPVELWIFTPNRQLPLPPPLMEQQPAADPVEQPPAPVVQPNLDNLDTTAFDLADVNPTDYFFDDFSPFDSPSSHIDVEFTSPNLVTEFPIVPFPQRVMTDTSGKIIIDSIGQPISFPNEPAPVDTPIIPQSSEQVITEMGNLNINSPPKSGPPPPNVLVPLGGRPLKGGHQLRTMNAERGNEWHLAKYLEATSPPCSSIVHGKKKPSPAQRVLEQDKARNLLRMQALYPTKSYSFTSVESKKRSTTMDADNDDDDMHSAKRSRSSSDDEGPAEYDPVF